MKIWKKKVCVNPRLPSMNWKLHWYVTKLWDVREFPFPAVITFTPCQYIDHLLNWSNEQIRVVNISDKFKSMKYMYSQIRVKCKKKLIPFLKIINFESKWINFWWNYITNEWIFIWIGKYVQKVKCNWKKFKIFI